MVSNYSVKSVHIHSFIQISVQKHSASLSTCSKLSSDKLNKQKAALRTQNFKTPYSQVNFEREFIQRSNDEISKITRVIKDSVK